MVAQKYRWDFIGLSTDTKPTPETSEKVVNGSTYYCSDTSKLYVYCDGTWYERKPLGGDGGSYTAGTGIDITNDTISLDAASQASLAKADTSVQNTDYATTEKGGTIRISNASGLGISNGNLYAVTKAYNTYSSASGNMFISKGTLENVIEGKGLTYTTFTGTDGTSAGTSGLVPAPATTDAGKFLKADGTWATAGGSSVTVVQSTGTSTSSVMSQNAATKLVYPNVSSNANGIGIRGTPSGSAAVSIGGFSQATGLKSVALGMGATAVGDQSFAAGNEAYANAASSVAIGYKATANAKGEFAIGTVNNNGYNNTNYRLISGVYDGVNAHDAVTVGQVNATIDAINTALSVNIPHIGATT